MAVLSDRNRDPAGPAAELEDRPAGATCQAAEPLDVRSSFEWRGVEVVERREAGGLGLIALSALPVTRRGRHDQSPTAPETRSRLIDVLTAEPLVARFHGPPSLA